MNATRSRRERRAERAAAVKTKELMAKNLKPGAIVILSGGLGILDVAHVTTTERGNTRLEEKRTIRPGNRRRRCQQARTVVVDSRTKMTVVK